MPAGNKDSAKLPEYHTAIASKGSLFVQLPICSWNSHLYFSTSSLYFGRPVMVQGSGDKLQAYHLM